MTETLNEVQLISDQLHRAFEGDAWHGDPVTAILGGINAAQAMSRPVRNGHSIWELVLHITVWQKVVRRRLQGEVITSLLPEQDWPPVRGGGEHDWDDTQRTFKESYFELRQAIENLEPAHLHHQTRGMDYTNYVMLHGAVQHLLYHGGQIALLKKALS